jgi:hypothetical protein
VQSGRNVEVTNSFELVYTVIEGAVVIDIDYLKAKQEQCAHHHHTNEGERESTIRDAQFDCTPPPSVIC